MILFTSSQKVTERAGCQRFVVIFHFFCLASSPPSRPGQKCLYADKYTTSIVVLLVMTGRLKKTRLGAFCGHFLLLFIQLTDIIILINSIPQVLASRYLCRSLFHLLSIDRLWRQLVTEYNHLSILQQSYYIISKFMTLHSVLTLRLLLRRKELTRRVLLPWTGDL